MTGNERGLAVLASLENIPDEGAKRLAVEIRKFLGIEEPEHHIPVPFVQKMPPPEFPQFRVKFNAHGEEIARRRVDSMDDLQRLFKSEPEMLWPQSYAEPIEENR
jgi:hypothetical protein